MPNILCVSNGKFGINIARAIWILLALQMAKIVVDVVNASGSSLRAEPLTFKPEPPETFEAIIKELVARYGEGDLQDEEGDIVPRTRVGKGGNYRYRVAGECTVQVYMRDMEESARGWVNRSGMCCATYGM